MPKLLLTLLLLTLPFSLRAEPVPGLTPYSIEYHSEYRLGWFSFDIDATRRLSQVDTDRWALNFNAEASVASLQEYSEFTYRDGTIIPSEYRYRASGMVADDDRTLLFVEGPGIVKDLESGNTIQGEWEKGIQDNLTYMLQGSLYLSRGETDFVIPVFETRRTKDKRFRIIKREKIRVPAGEFDTIKVEQVRKNKDRELHAWFAVQPGYPLIRLSDKKDGDLKYRIEATSLSY